MLKKILPIVVGLGLFALVLREVDTAKTWAILRTADLGLCAASFATMLVLVYLKGIRWSWLLRMQGHAYSTWNCFLVYMGSLYWGNITPGRAGDFIKVRYLQEDLGVKMGRGMSSVLVDRVLDLYLMLILGGAGLFLNVDALHQANPGSKLVDIVAVFFGLMALATLLAFNRRIGGALLKAVFQRMMPEKYKESTDKAFQDFHDGMEAFYRPALLVPVLLSALSYLVFFWGCSLMAQSIGLSVGLGFMAFAISLVNIVSLLSLLGMGTRDWALILLFGLLSIQETDAFAFSMLLFFLGSILFTLVCFFCYLAKPIRLGGKGA